MVRRTNLLVILSMVIILVASRTVFAGNNKKLTVVAVVYAKPGFEDQVSHHGGLGGPQNYPFVLRPMALPYDGTPVVGATSVYKLLRSWRDGIQPT